MNMYRFQMGAELSPEMMQQMQGMPMEQGIPMEQGMPVEQGNGEASFAQQLMVIEQEIDKIQKEMKKLEKRNDRLSQNEYKRLEQQLMQLEQQKEMLRQQVEATRQQLEAQEQMQGEEYLDPNAQYEMSPEELDALEGQYQDVPMDEQINPEEMQMMQYGGKMQIGKKILNWLGQIPASETIGGQISENTMKNLDKDVSEGKISYDEYKNRLNMAIAETLKGNATGAFLNGISVAYPMLEGSIPVLSFADKATTGFLGSSGLWSQIPALFLDNWSNNSYRNIYGKDNPASYTVTKREVEERKNNVKNNGSIFKNRFGGKMQGGRPLVGKERGLFDYNIDNGEIPEDLDDWNSRKLIPISNSIKRTIPERKLSFNPYLDGYLTSINYYEEPEEPIIEVEDTSNGYRLPDYNSQFQKDIADSLYKDKVVPALSQQRKDRLKNNIQTIKDYFGDVEPINIAQAVLPFIGALDNSHAIDNELSKNLTYSDNPYYKPLDYVNETYDSQQKALDRSYAQQSNQARRDTNRAILSLQPRSVFGRDALMTAKNMQLDEAKEKLDSAYMSGLSSLTANRNKDYSNAYDKVANINLENDQLNKALLKNFYKGKGVRRKEIYDMFQEGQNRIANIIQNKKDLAYLNTDWYKSLTDKEKADLEYQRWLRYYAGKNKKAQQTTGTEG